VLATDQRRASVLAAASTELVSARLGLRATFVTSSSLAPKGRRTAMLLDILRKAGADEYLFGAGRSGARRHYLDEVMLRRAGVEPLLATYGPHCHPRSVLQDLAEAGPAVRLRPAYAPYVREV
jgi:hypothetical protein